jgi:hypothetical protein
VSEDIIEKIDAALLMERNSKRFDPFGGDVWDEDRVDRWGDGMRVRPAGTGIEEESEEAEAVVEAPGSAPICRGCRRPSLQRPVERDRLCCFCLAAPRCANERTNALNGRLMVCIRPSGHQPPCEEGHPDGSQWYPSGVEQDGYWVATGPTWVDETHVFDRHVFERMWLNHRIQGVAAPPVDESLEPAVPQRKPDKWWSRLFPGRSTR